MKNTRVFVLIFIGFFISLLSSCSGVTVGQDYEQGYNFSALKTYAWKPGSDGVIGNDLVDGRIRNAIENKLSAKSYQHTLTERPDFFVSYDMTIEQKLTSSGATGGISLGRSSRGRYGGVGISSGSQVHSYDQGTLVIDFTEPLEDKLIWRGISTQSVDVHSSPDKSTVIINETVEKMLSQFPPEK